MEEIVVKEYSEEHQEGIINLILNIQQNEFTIPITKEDQPDLSNIPNVYQAGYGNFWVALYNNQVVGTISLIDIGNNQAALRKMFVKDIYRGSRYNISRMLLQKLMTWASQYNIHEIYLGTTEKFLAAHRFYEKNKFVQIAKEALPTAFPIVKVDTRFYKIKL